jgi:hypothetical protein
LCRLFLRIWAYIWAALRYAGTEKRPSLEGRDSLNPTSEGSCYLSLMAAWAAANRAIGTRNGEQLT